MKRQIIRIDQEKCNGCGICADACHEGPIGIVDGKAALLRDDYCDGMGDCLPECPTGAISFEIREAAAYDETAVMMNKLKNVRRQTPAGSCPGAQIRQIKDPVDKSTAEAAFETTSETHPASEDGSAQGTALISQLSQWPAQIKLVPIRASYFDGDDLLIAADCTAYAYADFHMEFMKNKVTLIGCPKLDSVDYAEKLAAIITANDIRSITVTRMEVPCCGGLEMAVRRALAASGKDIPCKVVTISIDGNIL